MQFDRLKRRDFITLIGGATAGWPFAARGQQSKVARIGVLYIGLADAESFKKELREGLRELGHIEGQNIAFEFRSGEGKLDRLPELAAELVRLKVDVIVPLYVPSALAAKQATREIPIVIIAADPVEVGIVPSLARPGGKASAPHLPDADRPSHATPGGQTRDLPGSGAIPLHVMWPWTPAGRQHLA